MHRLGLGGGRVAAAVALSPFGLRTGIGRRAGRVDCLRLASNYVLRDSETLWRHTIACTSNNYLAHEALGKALAEKGHIPEAEEQFHQALEIWPDDPTVHFDLGVAAAGQGRWNDAIREYRRAIEANPLYAAAYNNLANVYIQVGYVEEAVAY